jgi:hypothetical protein
VLVTGIYVLVLATFKTWMTGISPAMTRSQL